MEEFYHFDLYQLKAEVTAVYPNRGNNLYYPALGLAGEAGEVCEKIKKLYRDKTLPPTKEDKEEIAKELGDVLWYVATLATEIDFSLADIVEMNLDKLQSRMKRKVLKGSGDNR
jgi:NTP pyrophosphatase (non-canonical NTP hydrolase)